LEKTPVNSELALACNQYGNLIGSLRFIDIELGNAAYYYNMQTIKNNLVKEGAKLTAEEKEMFEFIKLNFVDDYKDAEIRNFSKLYRTPWEEFRKKYSEAILFYMNNYYEENQLKNTKNIFGIENGLVLELPVVQNYLNTLKKDEKPNVGEFNTIKNEVKNPGLKEFVISKYYIKKAETEAQSTGEIELKTEGDKIFHNIIKNYKGKVIYVDFWATWCGPCKAGIEQIKPLKEEMKNENVAFVYITNPTSPDKDYAKAKPDIKGEHFKVTADEWNHLAAKFNIYGIPHYALVDKSGKIINPHMSHLDNEELKKVLIEQMNK
jgi:thiol-disulfide isomerase/thioredoxin